LIGYVLHDESRRASTGAPSLCRELNFQSLWEQLLQYNHMRLVNLPANLVPGLAFERQAIDTMLTSKLVCDIIEWGLYVNNAASRLVTSGVRNGPGLSDRCFHCYNNSRDYGDTPSSISEEVFVFGLASIGLAVPGNNLQLAIAKLDITEIALVSYFDCGFHLVNILTPVDGKTTPILNWLVYFKRYTKLP